MRDFPGHPVFKDSEPSMQGAQVPSLVREQRSPPSCPAWQKQQNKQKNILCGDLSYQTSPQVPKTSQKQKKRKKGAGGVPGAESGPDCRPGASL